MSVTISGSGQIIKQVIQSVKTDTFSTASTSFVDVTGLTVSITPTNASNKILIVASTTNGMSADYVMFTRLARNGTGIDLGDAASTRTQSSTGGYQGGTSIVYQNIPQNICYLDSPATTSAITYSVQVRTENAGSTVYVNRTANDGDSPSRGRYSSTITVMEVAYA